MFTDSLVLSAIISATVGLGTWLLVNFLARPILDVREKRFEAIRLAERYALTQASTSQQGEDRIVAAKAALLDIAVALRAHSRGQSRLVRLYCYLAGYDLDQAVGALNGLHAMAGSPRYHDSTRMNNLDLVYLSLNAHRHLTAEKIAELERLVAEYRQSEAQA